MLSSGVSGGYMKSLLFVFCLLIAITSSATDKYWIVMPTDNDSGGDPIKIMQIDVNGNITIPPVDLIPYAATGSCACEQSVAMSYDGSGNMIVWIANDSGNAGDVYRAIVNPNTMTIVKNPKKVLTGTQAEFVHATVPLHIVAMDKPEGVLKGYYTDSTGTFSLGSVRLSPRYEKKNQYHSTSIASDGGMSLVLDSTGYHFIAVQPLSPTGGPIGDPVNLLNNGHDNEDADITSALPNGRRYIAYIDYTSATRYMFQVDAVTGKKISGPQVISDLLYGEGNQSLAIDPDGRFVLFDVGGADSGCSGTHNDPLFFLPLNQATGQPSGPAKQLTDCHLFSGKNGVFGFNLIKAQ